MPVDAMLRVYQEPAGKLRILLLSAFILGLTGDLAAMRTTQLHYPGLSLLSGPREIGQYEIAEYSLGLTGAIGPSTDLGQGLNPYDADDVDVWAEIRSPSGKTIRQNAFYDASTAIGSRAAKSGWKVRVAPLEIGDYSLAFFATMKGIATRLTVKGETALVSKPAAGKGFIRADPVSRRYLRYDSGEDYAAVGLSVAWVAPDPIAFGYKKYFNELAAQGCDYSRVWVCDWSLSLEIKPGRYSNQGTKDLDTVLALAQERGLAILVTLDTYGSFMAEGPSMWGENRWSINPYNKRNGGPIADPNEYWTNAEVKRLYKNRLRYILARYGAYRSLLAIELFSEMNAPAAWIGEMAGYGRSVDPHGHLWTTSIGFPWGAPYDQSALWSLPELDYVAYHLYHNGWKSSGDWRKSMVDLVSEYTSAYDKPFLFEEIGLDFAADDKEYDRGGTGLHIRQAFWSALCSGSLGIPMSHWKEYFAEKGLYPLFKKYQNIRSALTMNGKAWTSLGIQADHDGLFLTGIRTDSTALFWASNKEATWKNAYRGIKWKAAPPHALTLRGLGDGRWRVQWIDTEKGEFIKEQNIICHDGTAILEMATLECDIACLLTRLGP
jgi:hypothetical protein